MSTYKNPSFNVADIIAEAHAKRAQVIGDGIVQGVRFLATKFGGAVARLQAAQKQRVAVAQLLAMDERMLQDIGLNRSLVPFVVAGAVKNRTADLYADVGLVGNASANNDNGYRHAA